MTRKILFSVLVIGAVLITVAGFTFAVFTDNVAFDNQDFGAGTVDIVVNGEEDDYFGTSVQMSNMTPGDYVTQDIDISNDGTLPVFYHIWTYKGGDIFSCDPNPDCNMKVEFEVPNAGEAPDYALNPGDVEMFDLNVEFPYCAGNLCQDEDGYLQLFIHAWQQNNLEDYDCVKLEDKDENYVPNPNSLAHGNVCYKAIDADENGDTDGLHIIVNGYGLNDADFQLALDGGDVNDPNDGACTPQDDALAAMSADPYVAGYWNWGSGLVGDCDSTNGGEGVWNYAGVYGGVQSTGGAISYESTLDLPPMSYIVKANVKEISGPPSPFPGDTWTSVLSGLDYLSFTIDE